MRIDRRYNQVPAAREQFGIRLVYFAILVAIVLAFV